MNRITVSEDIYLAPIAEEHVHDLVRHANDEDVSRNLCEMPYPYALSDAMEWLDHVAKQKQKHGFQVNWSIFTADDELIGGIGRHVRFGIDSHKDEIGYWIGREFWGRGIMTDVVRTFSYYLFENQGLCRIEAVVFERNEASGKVLEKVGYVYEGTMRKAYRIDGELINGRMYALLA